MNTPIAILKPLAAWKSVGCPQKTRILTIPSTIRNTAANISNIRTVLNVISFLSQILDTAMAIYR
ncbi:MAG: hypothetical protein V3V88_01430 [Dehalococcoidia bacterium]